MQKRIVFYYMQHKGVYSVERDEICWNGIVNGIGVAGAGIRQAVWMEAIKIVRAVDSANERKAARKDADAERSKANALKSARLRDRRLAAGVQYRTYGVTEAGMSALSALQARTGMNKDDTVNFALCFTEKAGEL